MHVTHEPHQLTTQTHRTHSLYSTTTGKMRAKMHDSGRTAAELDDARMRTIAYEYLCHLEEARKYVCDNATKAQNTCIPAICD